jgi:hypothetical protein
VGALALALAGSLALAAAAAAEYPSPPLLEVTTISHYEPEVPSEPGKTELDIQATFGWHVTVTVRAHGATVLSGEAHIEEAGEFNPGSGVLHTSSVPWSCKQPGTVYSYEANCRKVGGKPVTIQTDEGLEIVCRSQTGGIVEA